jgi:hypothetical protein
MKRQHLISLLVLLSIQTFVSASTLYVPSRDYLTIQSAINAAVNGDEVVVAPGVYTGYNNVDLDFGGKAITVKSQINPANPNPAIIASTIIDCGGDRYTPHRAFYFRNGEGANSKVLGFTIRNGYARGPKGADGAPGYIGDPVSLFVPIPSGDDPLESPPYALNGANASGSGYGGAILCAGASPTIQYCVISNCTVTGAQGGNGANGLWGVWSHWTISDFNTITGVLNPDAEIEDNPDGQWGGSGGTGSGNGYGGGITCLAGSSPSISDCIIKDNIAHGGCGGDGGAGGNAVSSPPNASPPNYNGGNESFGGNAGNSIGDGRGGAIYCDSASNPTITNCIFSNNIATTGARAVGGLAGQGNTIPDNEGGPATDGTDSLVFSTGGIAGGAAYYKHPSNANFIKCTFTGNKAYEAYVFYDPMFMFILGEDISAYTVGGALYSDTSNVVTLNTCDFINNMGGAVYCGPSCTVSINNTYDPNHKCLFTANSDPNDGSDLWVDIGIDFGSGGAIYLGPSSSANIQNCIFGANSAKNDGGALKCKSNITLKNCSFGDNTAESGYGGAIDVYLTATPLTIDANNCSFSGNRSLYGGGFSSENFTATFTNCYFVGNAAEEGGGLDLVNGNVSISGGIIKDNNATDGYGGGLSCSYTAAQILHCTIVDNIANGSYPTGGCGGAINFEGWSSAHRVFNCLITGNSAAVDGGAIFCSGASPEVGNCTFSGNLADVNGGAIFSDFDSEPNITDCVFKGCNSHAIHEEDFGGNAIVKYSLFYNNPDGDYYDSGTRLTYTGAGEIGSIPGGVANLYGNPLFVAGPLGNYYLSQIAAGQGSNSPAINNGSNTAANLGLNTFTTRTDNVGDAGQVDRGYHYPDSTGVGVFQLTASVIGGNGTIEPTSGTYYAGTVVTLTATPDAGWRVGAWTGTDNDTSTDLTSPIVMYTDRTVTVRFEQPRTLIVSAGSGEPGYYSDIQDAVLDANDGDTIVVYAGIYYSGYEGQALVVDRSVLITSSNPDDPCCVAATIIDGYIGTNPYTNDGVRFTSNTDAGTVLNGFTIQNCGGTPGNSLNGNRQQGHPNGYDGGSIEGPAIFIEPGASPTIKNCVFRDNWIQGGNGGNGVGATTTQNAGRGGWSGWARGGAIYCAPDSSATFINCRIIDNTAIGGNGGNGGNDTDPGGEENYGGNWSRAGSPSSPAYDIDPFSTDIIPIMDGSYLWERWEWDLAFLYWPIYGDANRTSYFGNYRWYSGYGGGAYCDVNSNVTFIDCEISGNLAQGGMSGQGGLATPSQRPEEPLVPYEIPSFGGGVYCAAKATVTFTGCTITDNNSSPPVLVNPNNPNLGLRHRLDPYLGHGGGVCAEDTAKVIFNNCTFGENEASVGGGLNWANANPVISDCNFTFNSAFHGGGLFGEHGPATIIGCNITNNEAVPEANDPNIYEEVLGAGGGMHCWATDVNIIDCNISSNQAEASGGGVYFRGEGVPSLLNCLVTNNTAGRDGGGVSANIFSQLTISNCTIAGNIVTGIGFEAGYGGGLYCSHDSYTNIINSILWGNSGQRGPQLAIGTGFEYDPRPSTVDVSYSDVQGGQAYVFIDEDCNLNWGAGNIHANPLFVTGPLGNYYLSQIAAGQPVNSTCVNAGSNSAENLGMNRYTTRTDERPDRETVDMGYHYPFTPEAEPCRFCELFRDGIINFEDFAVFALNWLSEDCNPADEWCQHADVTLDTHVNFEDVQLFAECWLVEDTYPPTPNPSEWEIEPYSSSSPEHPNSISMTARTASDAWDFWVGHVQYYFDCVYGDCNDSGWQEDPNYTDPNLVIGIEYGYRVRARDVSKQIPDDGTGEPGNKTGWSPIRYAIVGEEPPPPEDHNPPTPNPMTWATVPYATSPTSIAMVATTATDDTAGVEYYFEDFDFPAVNSGWQSSPVWVDTTCAPETTYRYRVMARDTSFWHNQTGWSTVVDANTPAEEEPPPQDTTPPAPVAWEIPPYETGSGMNAYANMTAAEAIDPEGNGVWYYFECVGIPSINSGWMAERVWNNVPIGRENQFLYFHFRVRDNLGNTSNWSTSLPCY